MRGKIVLGVALLIGAILAQALAIQVPGLAGIAASWGLAVAGLLVLARTGGSRRRAALAAGAFLGLALLAWAAAQGYTLGRRGWLAVGDPQAGVAALLSIGVVFAAVPLALLLSAVVARPRVGAPIALAAIGLAAPAVDRLLFANARAEPFQLGPFTVAASVTVMGLLLAYTLVAAALVASNSGASRS